MMTPSTVINANAVARTKALSLYRQLMRGSKKMPTTDRKEFVRFKTRTEFRENMHLTDPEKIDFHLRLAEFNLDTVLAQAEHLSTLFADPRYHKT
mmetsp:Transcript_15564/g.24200  ORF Transcript_15564/g.24200 Transcript_15564/m.24200 type:complete len:95 (+) Transcript_15564:280-564(+)